MKKVVSMLLMVGSILVSAQPPADRPKTPDGSEINAAKAAEFALHVTERMTAYKVPGGGGKRLLEAFYKNKLKRVVLVKVEANEKIKADIDGEDVEKLVAYKFKVETYPDDSKQVSELVVPMDKSGYTINVNDLVANKKEFGDPKVAPVWEDKNAAELAEEALHYIIDQSKVAEFRPYIVSLSRLELQQERGTSNAVVDLFSEGSKKYLRIRLDKNGSYLDKAGKIVTVDEKGKSSGVAHEILE